MTFSPFYLLESQTSSPSSYGLPTSIPVRLPRQPPRPPVVHSVSAVYIK